MKIKQAAAFGAQLVLTVGALATVSGSLHAEEGTAVQRAACTPDVFRYCTAFIPNHAMIENCLRHNSWRLNKKCKAVFEGRLK
jgi:hypothetical protein